ncbi:MAG TPA: hypothetical protein VGQ55_08890, partial [Pyrinomonadaceae bacterium]|nr:hypothetical protein [Pyrinomonadaceae bacterium]
IDMRQGQPPLENVFRIVIVAAAPLPRENYSVWVDQTQMDAYQIKPNEIAALIYAGKLPNGTIKVGLSKRSESDPTARLVLPGTLSVPPEYATPSAEIEAIRPIIKLRRVPPANRAIELSVVIPQTPCEMSNTGFHLTVEGHTSICAGRQEFVIWFTPEQFSQLRDGADIILRGTGGSGVRNVSILGQLDKRLLQ